MPDPGANPRCPVRCVDLTTAALHHDCVFILWLLECDYIV